ncbi:glycosyltransferase [Glutamicibacter sp. HZAU]|uniref:glycosyltransferase n=1 Tax=Glutamicibacter sp. HZAU TaxID=2049891 RepID=UPI001375DD4F|nr:glycosyltransferase [Glutamicibacter sp. HZAU]
MVFLLVTLQCACKPSDIRMIRKLRGFQPWQVAVLAASVLGFILAIFGGLLKLNVVVVLGIGVAVLGTSVLLLLFSRQTWRQLKKLDAKVGELSYGVASIDLSPAPVTSDGTSAPQSAGTVPAIGLDNEWARRMPHIRADIETFALRSKSIRIRDSIALAATKGALKYRPLRELLAVTDMGMIDRNRLEAIRSWDKDMLLTLARLAANQRALESDMKDSARLFNLVERYFGIKALGRNDRLIYVEVLTENGELKKQREAIKRFGIRNKFPVQGELLRLNSVHHVDGGVTERWLTELNGLFRKEGLAEVHLEGTESVAAIDRLHSKAKKITDGPKVSVLVPSFRGGELLKTALNSLLEQTWDNLEIIVIDDCSGEEYEQYLAEAEAMSPKIKVLRQPENLGAYCARNAGLTIARGEFITVHDDDDWSHPDKIALQVSNLIENPSLPGNMSLHARSTDDLKFLRINNNPQFAQPNFSSLMVRRSIFDEIGPWDTVNRGADAEFRDRLVRRFGTPIQSVGQMALSFTRTREGSLTAGEMSRGFVDPSRLLYLASYTKWHGQFADSPETIRRGNNRAYMIPSTMEAGKRGADLGKFDVVYVTDFRFPGGTTSLTLAEMKAVAQSGKRVGFIHLESPLNKASTPINDSLFMLQKNRQVEQLSLGDIAHAHVLIVRHPSVVTFLDRADSKISVDHLLLIVNNPPVNKGGSGMVFDLEVCIANMDRLFDSETYVIGESDLTRKLSIPLAPASRLLDSTWPGVIASGSVPSPDFEKKPVLGRHSRDHALKWPSTLEAFRSAYVSDSFETVFLGGAAELRKKLGDEATEGVYVHEFGVLEVDDFLGSVDFWAYFHDDKLTESFGMSTAEAMAAGKVVILPKYMETTFGDGALYADVNEVETVINRYWSDHALYLEQSERARKYIADRYGVEALMNRLESFDDQEVA